MRAMCVFAFCQGFTCRQGIEHAPGMILASLRSQKVVCLVANTSCNGLQVRQEAEVAFGKEEVEPSRHAAEEMLVTVSSLKVCCPE